MGIDSRDVEVEQLAELFAFNVWNHLTFAIEGDVSCCARRYGL